MEAHTFDRWTVAIASRPTRRTALRFLAGGLIAALYSTHRTARAQSPTAEECAALGLTVCPGDRTIDEQTGEVIILNRCVDLSSDPFNCGACGYGCGGSTCAAGSCLGIAGPPADGLMLSCADAGLTDCGGVCVDVWTDPSNCGGCGGVCGVGDACFGGACLTSAPGGLDLGACAAQGLTDCGGICVDLTSHAGHCGACFESCPLGGVCRGGICGGLVCPEGRTNCGIGRCVDLSSDSQYCGSCLEACYGGATCQNGACV